MYCIKNKSTFIKNYITISAPILWFLSFVSQERTVTKRSTSRLSRKRLDTLHTSHSVHYLEL